MALHELIELTDEKDLEGKIVYTGGKPNQVYDYQALNERLIQLKELRLPSKTIREPSSSRSRTCRTSISIRCPKSSTKSSST
jgi:hypothetical protein